MTAQVLIAGAGPTGLMLALRLARHGIPLRIIDQAAGPGHASRAMTVHARTLEFYRQMGLADEIVAHGVRIEALHLRERGEEVACLPLKDIGAGLSPYPFVLAYPQDDHERFLVRQLKLAGIEVEWNTALSDFSQDEQGIHALLERDGVESQCDARFLCGCDGAHSRVREVLQLGFPGGTYAHLYYVADVKVSGPPNTDLRAHIGEQTFALMLPVRSSGMQRLIGIMPASADHEAQHSYADVQPIVEPLLGIHVDEVNWFSTYRVHHRVAQQFRVGHAFILGDAAHVHSPAGGQGMNTGLGDAVNLSWKIAQVLQGRLAPASLDSYEDERIAFARKLVATTDRVFQAAVAEGAAGQLVRHWLLPHVAPFLTGFAAARRAMFKALSQVQLNYEDSALSAGRAGDVLGGDRLPWVHDEKYDNFDPLRSMDWQLHVYGECSAALASEARTLGLPVHCLPWTAQTATTDLLRDAAYLIRPDGYVALCLPRQESGSLSGYTMRHGLHFAGA